MRHLMAGLLWIFASAPLLAQAARAPLSLDSGSVVRLHWTDGKEKARLLAPLEWNSTLVRYCRYPSPVCGGSTLNPQRTRPVGELTRLEVRRGSRTGRGALIGAGFGTLGGLVVLCTERLGDGPHLSKGQQVLAVAAFAAAWGGLGTLIGGASDEWATAP
jgi:hypothetical protein